MWSCSTLVAGTIQGQEFAVVSQMFLNRSRAVLVLCDRRDLHRNMDSLKLDGLEKE
jgi:hypothetical protein